MIQNDVECTSDDHPFYSPMTHPNDKPFSLNECIDACVNKAGCQFIIFGINDKAGECWMEKTADEFCPEGFEKDDYNFYMIKSKSGFILQLITKLDYS